MSNLVQDFITSAEKNSFDNHRKLKIISNTSRYVHNLKKGEKQYKKINLAKARAAFIKHKGIENLEQNLIEFEGNFIQNGGKVIWAQDIEEAQNQILNIINRVGATRISKTKSTLLEEIDLKDHLKNHDIFTVESDLGDYIVEAKNQKSSHIVSSSMHLSKDDITNNEELNIEDVSNYISDKVRKELLTTDVSITGANFLLADVGGVSISENEGNGFITSATSKVQIVVAGIEKILPTISNLDLFLPLLSTYSTGQQLSIYNTILTGPKQAGEIDGPDEMYVVLLDNGRSNLLAAPEQRQALSCIQCGACSNVCPIYNTVGGDTYNTTYGGPIGSVITPHLKGKSDFSHLSYASSLCGKCTEVCPVNIEIHKLLLANRRDDVKQNLHKRSEKIVWYFFKKGMMKRKNMDKASHKLKNFILRQFFKKKWGNRRNLPEIAPKSFNQLWEEQMKGYYED